MAKTKYQIDIDGYIGESYYSKRFVRQELAKHPNNTVYVRINSMGGSLDHGLDICDRFREHGNVECDMFGMNASAATIATLKAKVVRISSSGLYLIHKVMNWVDIWGQMNADQIAEAIADLEANKEENKKIDLMVAQMYSEKSGKPINDILELMKVGGWLTAQEAKDWGFVDEIIKTNEKMNLKAMGEKINAFGLPTNFISKSNFFTNIKTSNPMKKQPLKINAVLKVDKLESTEEDGVFLNEEQVNAVDDQLTTLENQVATLTTEKTNAETRATTAEGQVAEKDTEIANLKTQVENLKKNAGDTTTQVKKTGGESAEASTDDDFSNTVSSAQEMFDMLP